MNTRPIDPREYMTRAQYHQLRRERWRAFQRSIHNDAGLADSPSWVQAQLDRDARKAADAVPGAFDLPMQMFQARVKNRRRSVLEAIKDRRYGRSKGWPVGIENQTLRRCLSHDMGVPACRLPADRAPSALQVAA